MVHFLFSDYVSSETEVNVLIEDVNDNAPQFVEDPVIIGISEKVPFNTIIEHLQVHLVCTNPLEPGAFDDNCYCHFVYEQFTILSNQGTFLQDIEDKFPWYYMDDGFISGSMSCCLSRKS